MPQQFSLAEASVIGELSPEVIRTILEKNKMPLSRRRKVGKTVRHGFSLKDILLLKLLAEFPFPLSKNDKTALKSLLTEGAQECGPWHTHGPDVVFTSGDMVLVLECKGMRERLTGNASAFSWGKSRVVCTPDILNGTPVFRGTRIPIDHVAGLLHKGITEQEILEDFPSLSKRDLSYARLHDRLGTRPGRPKKRIQLRRKRQAA